MPLPPADPIRPPSDPLDRLERLLVDVAATLREVLEAERAAQPPGPERLLSIDEAAEALNVGRTLVYQELQRGNLRSLKIGRRRLVPASAVAAYRRSIER